MFCIYCGNDLLQDAKVCTFCGKEVPAPHRDMNVGTPVITSPSPKPAKKRGHSLLFILIGILLGAILLATAFYFAGMLSFGGVRNEANIGGKIEGPGFDTPEAAAEAYLTALRDQDIDAMVATFAVESYADNYDLQAMYDRFQAYVPSFEMLFPSSNSYNTDMNTETRQATIINQIAKQYMFYNVPSIDMWTTTLITDEPDLVADLEEDTGHYVFADLKITGTQSPEELSEVYTSERNQENIAAQAKPYGADAEDVTTVVITFEADGEKWYFCPQLIRYEDNWYIQTINGNLAAILGLETSLGGIVKES